MLPIIYADLIDDPRDQIAFEDICRTFEKRMYLTAKSILKNDYDAEDAVQNALIGIARNMPHIRNRMDERTLKVYVISAARNAAFDIYKVNKRWREHVPIGAGANIPDKQFWRQLEMQTDYEKLVEEIYAMPEEYKWPLAYHFIMEHTVKETADLLGISVSAAKFRLVKGKKALLSRFREKVG